MFSVFVPVGPSDTELERLADTLHSLRAHADCREVRLTLIDDSPTPRSLENFWRGATIVRSELWRDGVPDPHSAMTAGTIEALRRAEGEFALKLDTDAVIIAPFASSLRSAFANDPGLGIVGAFDLAAAGGRRDWSIWRTPIRRARWPIRVFRDRGGLLPRVAVLSSTERRSLRSVVRSASANPSYSLGAHCLGGSYAVSSRLFARKDLLDWRPWIRTHLSEDVVLGLLCAAAGLRMRGMVGAGEPFAVSWKGLPAAPERLVERRHSIVHSVRDGPDGNERELRAWFRAHTR